MATQQHRIRRQVLEIHAPEEKIAVELERELGRVNRQYLLPIIDECCSELSSPDRLHRIDKLEVDLGDVRLGSFEVELAEALKPAIRQALRRRIEPLEREERRKHSHPAITSQLELLAFFAENGTLPWWADSGRPRHLHESLQFLLERAPEELASLLTGIVRHRQQMRRIVLHCDDDLLLKLFDLLSSSARGAGTIRQQLRMILRSFPFPGAQGSSRAKDFWVAVLTNVPAQAFQGMTEASESTGPSAFWLQVFAFLIAVAQDACDGVFEAILTVARSAEPASKPLLLPVVAAMAEFGETSRIPQRLLSELVELLRASQFAYESSPVIRQSTRRRTRGETMQRLDRLDDYSHNQVESGSSPDFESARDGRQTGAIDLLFSDADSVYIENSGLVILWPFLERFFDRLQLLEDRTFADEAARHRAVGLLQYLITEDPSPPEYQMLLNKLLCGMDPNDVLDFGPDVTDAESEECATLFSAVIENAPVLRNMSHEGFRGSFLLRQGSVSAGSANWILRVQRETFDVVLDRFPWSFSWIKLPWMEIPLAVEW